MPEVRDMSRKAQQLRIEEYLKSIGVKNPGKISKNDIFSDMKSGEEEYAEKHKHL